MSSINGQFQFSFSQLSHVLLMIAVILGCLLVIVKQALAMEILEFDPSQNYFTKSAPIAVTISPAASTFPVVEPDFLPLSAENVSSDQQLSMDHDECQAIHNSRKNYSLAEAAELLVNLLQKDNSGKYAQFRCRDPYSNYIPEAAKQIYRLSITWRPIQNIVTKKYANSYVQCVTFIFMVFQLAGDELTKIGRTNAADLLLPKYTGENKQFVKFKSGEAISLPQVGDVAVWSTVATGTAYGHTGLVLEVRANLEETKNYNQQAVKTGQSSKQFGIIRIVNANSTRLIHEYKYEQDEQTSKVTLKKVAADWPRVPDYWLRKN